VGNSTLDEKIPHGLVAEEGLTPHARDDNRYLLRKVKLRSPYSKSKIYVSIRHTCIAIPMYCAISMTWHCSSHISHWNCTRDDRNESWLVLRGCGYLSTDERRSLIELMVSLSIQSRPPHAWLCDRLCHWTSSLLSASVHGYTHPLYFLDQEQWRRFRRCRGGVLCLLKTRFSVILVVRSKQNVPSF
jgi:hypothetical protein